jgi:hypothetical protein
MLLRKANHWVQATPVCASLLFVRQWTGAPDPDRSPKLPTPEIND